jgi:membrane-associated phospholipid phosphatase
MRPRPTRELGAFARSIRWPLLGALPVVVAVARKRRDIALPWPLSLATVSTAPLAVALALPRGRARAAAAWAAHMWAYKVAFEIPYDRPDRLRERLHIDAPIAADEAIGRGEAPGARLQGRLRRAPELTWIDRAMTAVYALWDVEPHAALLWILARHPDRFAGAAARLGATFDSTLVGYGAYPSAPPWWASEREGRMGRAVRRVTHEVGKELRGQPRPGTDHSLGDNPWAAMPSDHLATAAMTAMVLWGVDPRIGAAGWAYAVMLAAALLYTGEHYVVDMLAGLGLALGVWVAAPALSGPAAWIAERLDGRPQRRRLAR